MIVLDQIIFKTPRSIFCRKHRRCGIARVAWTRTVKLFQNGKKMIIHMLHGYSGEQEFYCAFLRGIPQKERICLCYLLCFRFFALVDALCAEFRRWMLFKMGH